MSGAEWFTAADLAAAALPDVPASRRGVEAMAKRAGWRTGGHARRRSGRGGGWEYHWRALPLRAQQALGHAPTETPEAPDRDAAWAAWEAAPEAARDKARARAEVLRRVDLLIEGGCGTDVAVRQAAETAGVGVRSVYSWREMIEGVDPADRLAHLLPRHRSAARAPARADCDPAFWDLLRSLYLRPEKPTLAQCHRDAVRVAEARGWRALGYQAARRRIEADIPRLTRILARQGSAGLERALAPQERDRGALVAMEAVNADCHKIDVFVRWPDGTVNRPQIVAFQDIYSGKLLSWRVDHDPNKVMVMAAFSELVTEWGIPRRVLFDNGREFANKWMTGGAPTRFRFKVRDDDPVGVLPLLGIRIHWATPGRGQSKPIERAFRDLASDVAKDVRFAGAYVGHRPDAKPENYGEAAVDHELFLAVLAERIAEHNARTGRRSPTCAGRSFDATFADSYARHPVQRATDEQRRLWLMGQEVRRLHADHGRMELMGNRYYASWMSAHAGRQVVARFDPEDLHAGAHLYATEGAYLGFAPVQEAVGFFDATEARQHRKAVRDIKRAERALLEAERRLNPDQVAAQLSAAAPKPPARLEAKVVSPRFGAGGGDRQRVERPAVEARPRSAAEIAAQQELVQFEERARAKAAARAPDTPHARYRRALALEETIEGGRAITEGEAGWLRSYRQSPEYAVMRELVEAHGSQAILGSEGA